MLRIFITALSLLGSLALYSQVALDDVHVKAHFLIGSFYGSQDFNEIYGDQRIKGLDGLVGYKKLFLVGGFKKFTASGEALTTEIPGGSTAKWNEKFKSIGFRYYSSEKVFNVFIDGRFERALVTETIKTNNPAYSTLDSRMNLKCNGVSGALGAELKVWLISIEGSLTYSYIPTPTSYSDEYGKKNVGGLIAAIGMGLSL